MSTLLPHPGSGFTPYYYTPMSTQRTLLGYNPNASKPEALDKLYPVSTTSPPRRRTAGAANPGVSFEALERLEKLFPRWGGSVSH